MMYKVGVLLILTVGKVCDQSQTLATIMTKTSGMSAVRKYYCGYLVDFSNFFYISTYAISE